MKRCTMTLAALAVLALAAGSVVASGKGKGSGQSGANSGGGNGGVIRSQQLTGNTLQKQSATQKSSKVDSKVFSGQKVQLNHLDKGRSYSIVNCPTKSWTKCDFGYCFKSKSCCHWEYKCWYPTYGCYFFYCPYTCVEYWFCVEDDCYYPVGYCPLAYRVKYNFGW